LSQYKYNMKSFKPLLVLIVLIQATLVAYALPAKQKPQVAQAPVTIGSSLITVTMSNHQGSKDTKDSKTSQDTASASLDSSEKA